MAQKLAAALAALALLDMRGERLRSKEVPGLPARGLV
jgi:hypothetical protein